MKQLTESLFKTLEASAASTPRKRAHHNLHEDLSDPVQRLCVAIEPGSYIRPHRHSPGNWELFLIFKGSAAMLIFDEQGKVIDRAELEPGVCSGAEAPGGEWHTLVATGSHTMLMEIKKGPYAPLGPDGLAPWAPEENTEKSGIVEQWFRGAEPGDAFPNIAG
jgi:cupin fold WbuC family metalloprotein